MQEGRQLLRPERMRGADQLPEGARPDAFAQRRFRSVHCRFREMVFGRRLFGAIDKRAIRARNQEVGGRSALQIPDDIVELSGEFAPTGKISALKIKGEKSSCSFLGTLPARMFVPPRWRNLNRLWTILAALLVL